MKRALLFLAVGLTFLFTTSLSRPDSLSFHVYDTVTGKPLIGATIVIRGTTFGCVTDIEGNASMTVPSISYDSKFQVSCIGYNDFTDRVGNGTRFLVPLIPINLE